MMRKCSKCGKTGHNSRTCRSTISRISENGQYCMKFFGVELVSLPSSDDLLSSHENSSDNITGNYLPNGLNLGTSRGRRKKGVAWSEEEHRLFLLGLEKLGKGDWRGISRNFVTTRTSTQVASHAQKYFLRQNNAKNKHRRHPTLLSMVGRNEPQVDQNESSPVPMGMFPRSFKPISSLFKAQEIIPYWRLFSNSAAQGSPSLELSLAAPQPSAAVNRHLRVAHLKKQYVI